MEKAKQHAIQDNHFSEEELSRPETQNKIKAKPTKDTKIEL